MSGRWLDPGRGPATPNGPRAGPTGSRQQAGRPGPIRCPALDRNLKERRLGTGDHAIEIGVRALVPVGSVGLILLALFAPRLFLALLGLPGALPITFGECRFMRSWDNSLPGERWIVRTKKAGTNARRRPCLPVLTPGFFP